MRVIHKLISKITSRVSDYHEKNFITFSLLLITLNHYKMEIYKKSTQYVKTEGKTMPNYTIKYNKEDDRKRRDLPQILYTE